MWNYKTEIHMSEALMKKFSTYATTAGFLFIMLGVIGMFFPVFITMTTVIFVSFLMLFAGVSLASLTWMSNREDWMGWLKSFILIIISIFILFSPMQGAAIIGLILSMYFFMDAFANFGLAMNGRGQKTWWMWFINSIASFVLGMIIMLGWPFSSLYLVGIFVGISLLMDGIVLLVSGNMLNKTAQK